MPIKLIKKKKKKKIINLFVKYICNRLSGFGKFDIPCINTCYLTTDYADSFKWNTRYAVRIEKKVYEMVGHTSASSVTQG